MNLIETIKSWFGTKEETKPKPTPPVKQQKGLRILQAAAQYLMITYNIQHNT